VVVVNSQVPLLKIIIEFNQIERFKYNVGVLAKETARTAVSQQCHPQLTFLSHTC
jgi:hypothetical protein